MDEADIAGTIVFGEGERDEAPMLYIGEQVGRGHHDEAEVESVDIAVDPLEGTNLVATGQGDAITVLAASEKGGLTNAPDTYLEKLCVGPVAAGAVDIRVSASENCHRIAEALRRKVTDITVIILDRPRHADLIAEVRSTGARIKSSPMATCRRDRLRGPGHRRDAGVMGIGAPPEGVITAAACGAWREIQARFRFRNSEERERAATMLGHADEDRVYRTEELASGEHLVFAATGVTAGELLPGVRSSAAGPHPLAGDGLPDEAGPVRGHGPHVRSRPAARRPL